MTSNLRISMYIMGLCFVVFTTFLVLVPGTTSGSTRFQETDRTIVLVGKSYEIAFDRANGAIVHIRDLCTGKEVCNGNRDGILWRMGQLDLDEWRWRLVSKGEEEIVRGANQIARSPHIAQHAYPDPASGPISTDYSASNQTKRFFYQWEDGLLRLSYEGADGTVSIICLPQEAHVDFRVEIKNEGQTILTFNFPHGLLFDADQVKRVGWPMELGICLRKAFYEKTRMLEGTYPTLFSDFTFLESSDGDMRLYGIQDQRIFWPTVLGTGSFQEGENRVGFLDHGFFLHLKTGETWRSPTFRVEIGPADIKAATGRYASENGLLAGLSDKMPTSVYHRFCQSPIYHFDRPFGTFRDDASLLHLFPSPMILRLQHWMMGGFDREYPDFLPPNPRKGSPDAFDQFCNEAEQRGFLVETYINYTWISTDPPSPLFLEKGDDVFARNLDGSPYAEQYSSRGFTLSPSHPDVTRLHKATAAELTKRYGVDIIYHDQIGCRPFKYDKRSREHGPCAYIQDMIRLAEVASEMAPVACEGGFDRLIPSVSRFDWSPMGGPESLLDLPMIPGRSPDRDLRFWAEDIWEPNPWLLFLFHDKVSFSRGAIDLPELSWALLIGAQLHTPANIMDEREREWLKLICRIQKELSSEYMGKALTQFHFMDKDVYESRFNDVHIVCNLSPNPYKVSDDVVITGNGFYFRAEDGDITGGAFSEHNGILYEGEDKGILLQQNNLHTVRILAFFNRSTPVSIKKPASWKDKEEIRVYRISGDHEEPIEATITESRISFTADHHKSHLGHPLPRAPMMMPSPGGRPPINGNGSFVMEFLIRRS